jgi:transcriptional regulator with XRE-family HTH domain
MIDSIGKRIAFLRQKYGWTQQSLADRLAMSRVAISHIEMDLTIPSERSITLMAGVFKLSPTDLVEGTSYPQAKAERLPELTTTITELELNLALLRNDLEWLDCLDDHDTKSVHSQAVLNRWSSRLENWSIRIHDDHEAKILQEMRQMIAQLKQRVNHPTG